MGVLLVERRPVVGDPAVAHHHRAVDQRRHRAELVGDQHDGGAAGLEGGERVGEGALVAEVDAGGGLVEHQQVGLPGERASDEDTLLLPAAQLGHAEARPVGQPDDVDRVGDGPPVLAGEREEGPPPGDATRRDDLPDGRGYAAARGGALRHEADAPPVAEVGVRRAEEGDAATRHRQQAGDRAHEGRLAGAVGAHQCEELTGPDGEVDPAQDRAAADRDRPVVDLDRRCSGAHWHPLAFRSASRFWPMRER